MNYPDPLHRIINVIQAKYEVHVKNTKINVYIGCAYEKQIKINILLIIFLLMVNFFIVSKNKNVFALFI